METLTKGKNEASGKYTEDLLKVSVEDGVEIDVIVAKLKATGPHPALIFAHGGGGCL